MAAPASERALLHEALVTAFEGIVGALDGSRIDRRQGYLLLICPHLAQVPQCNGVWGDGRDAVAAADLERRIADFDRLGIRFWLQTRTGRHPSLEAAAARLGLHEVDELPGLVASPDDLAQVADVDLEIVRVGDDAGLTEALLVAAAGLEVAVPALAAFYTREVASLPGLSVYVGRAGGVTVSTAIGYVTRGTVGVFNVATPREHRRRGFGAALTARAIRDGFAADAQLAWLQSSRDGEALCRRMGFRHVETYRLFTRPRAFR